MAITKLNKELRKLRIDHDINRNEMAKALKITPQHLTMIESNKTEASDSLLIAIAEKYAEGDAKAILLEILREALNESIVSVSFDMTKLSASQKAQVMVLRRNIEAENASANELAEAAARKARELKKREREEEKRLKAQQEKTVSTSVESAILDEELSAILEPIDLDEAA